MKKILLLSLIIAGSNIFTNIWHANWIDPAVPCTIANATDVDATVTRSFPKGEWKKVLCLKQSRQVSVFTTIQRNLINDQVNFYNYVQYYVNGQPWDGSYGIPTNTWVDWLYWESSRPNPNATYTVWDIYSQEYWYDVSNPLCGVVTLYKEPNSTSQVSYTWGWTNLDLYTRIQCSDRYSGCPKEADGINNIYTDFLSLTHRTQTIDISFWDLVANQGTQTCNLNFWEYLYDPTPPKISSLTDDVGNNLTNWTSQSYFAGSHKWSLTVSDPFDNNDQWVSGIRSVSMNIKRIKNTHNEVTTPDLICSNTARFPVLANTNMTTNSQSLELDCPDTSGIQIAGTYELNIEFSDHAGNIITTNRTIFIAPNKNLVPKITKESYEKWLARVCLGTTDTTVCNRYTLSETTAYTNSGSCPWVAWATSQATKPILPTGTEYTGLSRDNWENRYICWTSRVDTPTTLIPPVCIASIFGVCIQYKYTDIVTTFNQQYWYPRTTFFETRTCANSKIVSTCTGWYRDSYWDTPSRTIYANQSDFYKYYLTLSDSYNNKIHNKSISNFIHTGTWIYLDSISNNWESALVFDHTNRLAISWRDGEMGYFTIQSYAGGQFWEKFSLDIDDWDSSYQNIGTKTVTFGNWNMNNFHKLFSASMKLSNNETDIVFGQNQSLEFIINRHDKAGTLAEDASVNFRDFIKSTPSIWWTLSNKTYSGTSNMESLGYIKIFDVGQVAATGSIDFLPEILAKFTGVAGIEASPIVKYTINNKVVTYSLSETVEWTWPLTLAGGEINSIFIGGYEQSQGKWGYVSSTIKIGENSWNATRNNIAKNVAILTRNRTPNDWLLPNGVKYVSGDQELSWEADWKTLIITDGNVTFTDNFNTLKRDIWIIVLQGKDSMKWNIYIKPNVAFIGGILFSEWSIESVGSTWVVYLQSNISRTTTLSKQIVFYWWLYTRNTVGGAILWKAWDNYMLPGWVSTNSIQEAIRYDLSFLRMRSGGKDDINWTKNYNAWRNESVVILNSTSSKENTPPGFEK
jgi:hypothetical protein